MRFVCLIALLVSGVSGEMSGCVVDSDGSRTCHGAFASGDVTSLLQMHARQQDAEEHHDKLVARTATVTRRCLNQDAVDHVDPDCVMSDWTDWGSCTKTCGSGTRSRSRTVTSGPADGGKCGCLEEEETCNSKPCTVDCQMGDWSAWTTCSGPCGTSSRSREVLSTPDALGLCDCTKEAKACNTDDCGGTLKPQDLTTPAPGAKLCVNVREAVNFESKIENAMVKLGEKEGKTSDSQGDVCWDDVADGDYPLEATHKDYVKWTKTVSFVVSHTEVYGVDMVKKTTGDWVIVLEWGEGTPGNRPVDLDSYTEWKEGAHFASGDDRDQCSVKYSRKSLDKCSADVTLDQDHCFEVMEDNEKKYTCPDGHSEYAKPETTTLKGVDGVDGEVTFHVVNFWKSRMCYTSPPGPPVDDNGNKILTFPSKDTGLFKQSKAQVTVYHGGSLKATYNAPDDGHWMWSEYPCSKNPAGSAEEWWVFSIDRMSGDVTPCDCTKQGPGFCGGCGR